MPSQVNLEEAIEESKRTFMNWAMKQEPEKVRVLYSTEIINAYWQPTTLKVVLNGKNLFDSSAAVQMYYAKEKGYTLQLYTDFVKEIEGVEILSRTEIMPIEFTYEGNTYKITNQNTDLEKHRLNYVLTMEELKQLFHAEIKLDKEKEEALITIQ